MRKTVHILWIALGLGSCLTATRKENDRVVVASILPLQYFADQLTGNLYRSVVMVPPGVGPETYNPTPRQMGEMAKAKVYFANGHFGFETAYLGKFQSINPNLCFVNTSEGVGLIHGEGHNHGEQTHEEGVDPHTWSTPSGARIIVRNMADALIKADPENKTLFQTNLNRLLSRIDSVDQVISSILSGLPVRKFMVFHPALGYFARDYQLEQLSIEFEGKIPTPKHIQQIVLQAKELKISNILIQREFDIENAEIIARETGSQIITIDPLSYNWPGEMISLARKMAGQSTTPNRQ